MTQQNRTRKPRAAPRGSAGSKGDLVEEIVARMHESPGLAVERNVFLPIPGEPGSHREIDVLVSGSFAGYPMRLAFECKNERGPVGRDKIDAFDGKLRDVGIPTQQG